MFPVKVNGSQTPMHPKMDREKDQVKREDVNLVPTKIKLNTCVIIMHAQLHVRISFIRYTVDKPISFRKDLYMSIH